MEEQQLTFEEILPELKKGAKIIREGWGGFELYVTLVEGEVFDGAPVTPYFLIIHTETRKLPYVMPREHQ